MEDSRTRRAFLRQTAGGAVWLCSVAVLAGCCAPTPSEVQRDGRLAAV